MRYRIVLKFFDPYIGSRNGGDKTLFSDLSLKEAHNTLLALYNEKFDGERAYVKNWGLAVIQSQKYIFGATKTLQDGTRTFDYDSRRYIIEEDEEG